MRKLGMLYMVFVINIFSASSAQALETVQGGITWLAAFGLGNVGVKVDSDTITNPNGCSNTTESTKLYKMIDTTDHGKNMLSILLSAKISDATVKFYIDEDECSQGEYAIIWGVILL